MRGFVRPIVLAVVAVMTASCSEAPSSNGALQSGRIALAPAFSLAGTQAYQALAAFGLQVTSVHVRLTAPDGSARDSILAFPVDSDTLHIELAVPLRTTGETFTADLDLSNSDGIVLFSGHQLVTAYASGTPFGSGAVTITVNYSGPGRDVSALTVSPATQQVTGSTSVSLNAAGTDALGARVPNVLVRWTTSDASIATIATSSNSTATIATTGKRGTVTITAITPLGVAGIATLSVVPPVAKLVVVSGSGQTAPAGASLSQPLVVELQAADNLPVPGVTVTFRALTAGGSVGASSVVTDATGRATTSLAVGQAAGAFLFEAAVSALPPVPVLATATPAPPGSIVVASGSGQSATVASALAAPFVVQVLNQFGALVSGATVQWSVVTGGGTLAAATSVTAADGTASMTYTLGTLATTETVRASLAGLPGSSADFSAKGTAGLPTSITGAGDFQHAPVGNALPFPLAVRVTDGYGNPVTGLDVVWRVGSSAGPTATFSPASTKTDFNGGAFAAVTLGGSAGSLTIKAFAGSLVRSFSITADSSTAGGPPGVITQP